MQDPLPSGSAALVTGCAGFIGYHLCEALLDSGLDVLGFDECNDFYDPAIKRKKVLRLSRHRGFTFIEQDLDKLQGVRLHTVFHLAAQASIRYCELNPKETGRCNESLTAGLLQRLEGPVHFIFVSSSSVYGTAPTPWGAETVPNPNGAYGRSKFRCEKLVIEEVQKRKGFVVTIVRPFSVVGPGIRPDLVPSVFADRLIHRDTIEIYGDGSARRDFTHVNDLIHAMVSAMRRRRFETDVRIIPVGRGKPRSINELLQITEREMRKSSHVVRTSANSEEVAETFADCASTSRELGFRPRLELEEAVRDMVLHPRPIQVVVVVATRGRDQLLRDRSLPSIQNQTLPPDRVCVVVDEDENTRTTAIESLREDFPAFQFIRNFRTAGASGAWNSGVMELTDLPEVQKYCYLAILDDDDYWEPNHLESCVGRAQNGLADWVVAGIVRHSDGECREQSIPASMRQEDFFVGNPHVQGSNMFVSLRLFYRAGMFDEHLPSSTDRDLCIRIFDVAKDDLNVHATGTHTVHHYADSDRLRLSSPHSINKRLGIFRFAYKHLRRMTPDQREQYWKRANDFFDVAPELVPPPPVTVSSSPERVAASTEGRWLPIEERAGSLLWNNEVTSIIFGVISDKPEVVAGLIEDISRIPNARLVLLANGHPPRPFEALLAQHSVPGTVLPHYGDRLSIAEARTYLQVHCGTVWKKLSSVDAVVIMDDDKRIPECWFGNLCRLLRLEPRPNGGFIGPDEDAPPLPAAFIARTSLVDLFYAKKLGTSSEELRSDLDSEDSFYDLSAKSFDHLEYPVKCQSNPTMESILIGIPAARKATPNHQPVRSTERGGCCVVLDPDLLLKYCNPKIEFGDIVTRRSDMIWAASTERTFIKHPDLAVRHDRTRDAVPDVDSFMKTAAQDLLGSAMCRRPEACRNLFLVRRLKQLGANILRIQGLEAALGVPPLLHFSYQRWVENVIRPVYQYVDNLAAAPVSIERFDASVVDPNFERMFRVSTARQIVEREFPELSDIQLVGLGSEGVTMRSASTPDLKYKVLDAYKPRDSTFSGERIPGLVRKQNSTVLVCPYYWGDTYTGGHGPAIVRLLRKIQDSKSLCFRNWKPANLVVNTDGVHFVDYGRDVVAYSEREFEKMVQRAYLSWRFPNHGDQLKIYFKQSYTLQIPQLEGVEFMFQAINDRSPDLDLYNLLEKKVREIPHGRVLDFGSGQAKFQRHTRIPTVNYDPLVSCTDPEVFNRIEDLSGKFDTVICARVLCVLTPIEFEEVIRQIRGLVENSGRVIISMCDPRGIDYPNRNPETCFSYEKTVSTGRSRPEWYRPLRLVRTALIRAGFEIEEEFVFWQINHERFEKHPNQWCCVVRPAPQPRHTLMIKTCFMEHRNLEVLVQHLVETLPCGLRTVLVLDGKREDFLREYDCGDEPEFRRKAEKLIAEGWIDHLLEPPNQDELLSLHLRWFGFEPDFSKRSWTHDDEGAQYASTFHGFDACNDTEFVLQVDSDLMVFRGEGTPKLPYSLFDSDPSALTWSLPIANRTSAPYSTGHRLEVRGCLLSIPRLRQLFRREQEQVRSSIGRQHWYRIVDEVIGGFKSYRGGQQMPFFVHPPNSIKKNEEEYYLAIDAVQSGRILRPDQFGKVDWAGFPAGRTEPFVILVCGRNVAAGRMLRCLDSIRRNLNSDVGLIVIDDASNRQRAEFLRGSLPLDSTTFVSRRKRVGVQANLALGIRHLCELPETVICTVDLDDALLGQPIQLIQQMYKDDPNLEAAFGGCVHVHKPVTYEIDNSCPEPPRKARGQPYWTHLRTFRKVLFDCIRKADLRITLEDSLDWAYCVPIWEQARKTKSLKGDLYLHEPGDVARDKDARELEIGKIMSLPAYSRRRPIVAVVGDTSLEHNPLANKAAFEVGQQLAKADYIVMTGGLGGVMEEACRGAKSEGGVTVGILPGSDPRAANAHVDVPIATDMSRNRNGIVALASAVVVVGGRAGTLSEVALAWSAKRLIIAMNSVPECSSMIAGKPIDSRPRYRDIPSDKVYGAETAEDVIALLEALLPQYQKLTSRL